MGAARGAASGAWAGAPRFAVGVQLPSRPAGRSEAEATAGADVAIFVLLLSGRSQYRRLPDWLVRQPCVDASDSVH
jgi:hypothetical protein